MSGSASEGVFVLKQESSEKGVTVKVLRKTGFILRHQHKLAM